MNKISSKYCVGCENLKNSGSNLATYVKQALKSLKQ